jgi:hypothetical protein
MKLNGTRLCPPPETYATDVVPVVGDLAPAPRKSVPRTSSKKTHKSTIKKVTRTVKKKQTPEISQGRGGPGNGGD